jgi:hypothetical protein
LSRWNLQPVPKPETAAKSLRQRDGLSCANITPIRQNHIDPSALAIRVRRPSGWDASQAHHCELTSRSLLSCLLPR